MRDVAHILAVSIHLSPLGYSLACWSTYLAVAPTGFLVPIQILPRPIREMRLSDSDLWYT